jgi:hypothetical protein
MRTASPVQELPARNALTVGVRCVNRTRKHAASVTAYSVLRACPSTQRSTPNLHQRITEKTGNEKGLNSHPETAFWSLPFQFHFLHCYRPSPDRAVEPPPSELCTRLSYEQRQCLPSTFLVELGTISKSLRHSGTPSGKDRNHSTFFADFDPLLLLRSFVPCRSEICS